MRQPHPDSMPTPDGWTRRHTGGGCWCLERELDGFSMQIFDAYGDTLPMSDAEEILVGFTLHQGGTDSMFFEEGNPPEIPELARLHPVCPFDVSGEYFSWIIQLLDCSFSDVIQVLNTISRDSLKYEIVIPTNRPEE
jgi:hypothetical protein